MSRTNTDDENTDDESLIMHDDFYQEELIKIINEIKADNSCKLPGNFTWIKGVECVSKENPVCAYCKKSI